MKELNDIFGPLRSEVSIIPVMQGDMATMLNDSELPDALPILALRNAVLFPGTVVPVTVGREKSMKLIKEAERDSKLIGTVPQKDAFIEDPVKEDLFEFGTVAKIVKTIEMPDGSITAILQGFNRFRVEAIVEYAPYLLGRVEYLKEIPADKNDPDVKAISDNIKDTAARILRSSSSFPKEAALAIKGIDNFEFLINFVATTIDIEEYAEKLHLLSISDLKSRSMKLLELLNKQLELQKIKEDINQKVKSEIDQQQREYYLNNQLRTIQEELGMDEAEEFRSLRERASKKDWSKETADLFEKEMQKLERSNPNSPDYNIQLNYLTFMLDLPWNEVTKDNLDICGEITFNGEKFYYGIMSGTSMASPQVCGIIACWLQAYPKLTPEEAVEIIQYTAKHDTYTGSLTQWDNQWGYGKIDAYAGLKECISRAHTVGINSPLNDSEAFTLLKSEKGWRILFNRPESHAVLTLTTLNGTTIENRKIAELPAAHEESITFSNLPHGVYILTVRTDRSSLSRKIAF